MTQSATSIRSQELFVHGAKVVVDGVPPGTEVGIDFKSWRTGERFRGIKMIPSGVHLLYYAAIDKTAGQPSMRSGLFVPMERRKAYHYKWDVDNEELVLDESILYTDNTLLEIESSMGAYPLDDVHKMWQSMSQHITADLLGQLLPPSGKVTSLPPSQAAEPSTSAAAAAAAVADGAAPSAMANPTSDVKWSKFNFKRSFPQGASPNDITRHSLDKSWLLQHVASRYARLEVLLGEFQLAFICFLHVHMYDAFEQWKDLFVLFCNCIELLDKAPRLFIAFLVVSKVHVELVPDDMFPPDVLPSNFLTNSIKVLHRNIKALDASTNSAIKTLQQSCNELYSVINKRFALGGDDDDEDDERTGERDDDDDDEDAPVVVEIQD